VGFSLWVAYGIALGNMALVLPNSMAFAFGAATILVARRLRIRFGTDDGSGSSSTHNSR
jgi:hypothetical protein